MALVQGYNPRTLLTTELPMNISATKELSTDWITAGLRDCSSTITISSSGPGGRVQRNVMGTYFSETKTVMKWPTWKMKCRDDRYLYRCPCATGKDWLFGKWNGNNVGWIKHRNCTGCPEDCSQNWLYWDDNVKKMVPRQPNSCNY